MESIGRQYGITRERVRQLEQFSLYNLRKSPAFASAKKAIRELRAFIEKFGRVVAEHKLLESLSSRPEEKNHIYFLLVLGDDFIPFKEDEEFYHRWAVDSAFAEKVCGILREIHKEIARQEALSEKELIETIRQYAHREAEIALRREMALSWIEMSKLIEKNIFGEWGYVHSPYIRPRGVRDLAFIVLKKTGKPLHFSEVAEKISEIFSRKAHPATVHNELIKDNRFVLIGRGIYALDEWGYKHGTVQNIIKDILEQYGALTREEVVEKVLEQRMVKENTILINLENRSLFIKNEDGTYSLKS